MAPGARAEFDGSERAEQVVAACPPYRGPTIILRALNLEGPTSSAYASARRDLMAEVARRDHGEIVDAPTGHFIQNQRPDLVIGAVNRVIAGELGIR
ncbi:hypothetical protein [Asticcacaulis sp. AC402]|uniref:hypothetical protein n=1 Tax=Asticcacaulis sp. AC402 TaxID=1282361 RepID=UPI0003C3B164|nr:hypothetical protein [Asticcacaulis sp. AC402]ESQ76708.1 hypothetical protein ABAC402_03265 [Asticcacaulis sp. AC402]